MHTTSTDWQNMAANESNGHVGSTLAMPSIENGTVFDGLGLGHDGRALHDDRMRRMSC